MPVPADPAVRHSARIEGRVVTVMDVAAVALGLMCIAAALLDRWTRDR